MKKKDIRVLVVEDNPGYANLIQKILMTPGGDAACAVECVEKLSAALERLSKPNVDAVLLDLTLPDSQGLDTFVKVHEHAPDVPVVILTGMDDESFGLEAIRRGAQDYLVKGQAEVTVLLRVVRYAIERKQAEKAPPQAQEAGLKAEKTPAAEGGSLAERLKLCGLYPWLEEAVNVKASDLFLSIGEPPTLKVYGGFKRVMGEPVTPGQLSRIIDTILTGSQRELFNQGREIDTAFDVDQVSRFRVNVFRASAGAAIAFRPIPTKCIPTIDELGLPQILHDLTLLGRGLILITGPTGNGKSTTLAAFLDEINKRDEKHIITIEDPIEYVIRHQRSLVHQREVELHTRSFADGLRSALRENPDIIMIGELRDLESISLALRAADTGHLVLGTLHSSNTSQAITRIIDVFDTAQKAQVQTQLAQSLQAIVTQRLLKRIDGQGMIVATEVLIATPAVRNVIRANQMQQIKMYLEMGKREGMHTIDQDIKDLVDGGIVAPESITQMGQK